MRQTALYIGLFLLLAPSFALAQTSSCSAQGYTVVYVNGIFYTAKTQAEADKDELSFYFNKQNGSLKFRGEPVDFEVGFNPSEVGGADDLLKLLRQLQQGQTIGFNEDHDVDQILAHMFSEVKTQKILLVGHSQGSFYTNEIYKYLIDNGVPVSAIGVYNVATPANYVAGAGMYLTSANDTVINGVRTDVIDTPALYGTNQPLPANIFIEPQPGDDTGHLFTPTYLSGAPQRMVSDIQSGLSKLSSSPMSNITSGCFYPPSTSLSHEAAVSINDYGDSTGEGMYVLGVGTVAGSIAAVQSGYAASIALLNTAATLAEGAYQFVADAVTLGANPPSAAEATVKTNTIINKLYGSSLDGLSAQDKKDLLGSSQGGAVALAVAAPKAPVASGEVLGTSTEIATNTSVATSTQHFSKSIFPSSSNGPVLGIGGGVAPSQSINTAETNLSELAGDDDVSDDASVLIDAASTTPDADASSTPVDEVSDASTTPDASASSTPEFVPSTGAIISSQEDSSGTPSHYWHSDGSTGAYLVLDPNGGPGYSLGDITTAATNVVGIHIKAQFDTDGSYSVLPRIPILYDESNNHPYACAQLPYNGYAYGSASDALTFTNPLASSQFNNQMVDMYFQCNLGVGHDQVYPSTSYRLYLYPISTTDVSDIYVAMNAAGTMPFYEVSDDGTY